MAEVVAVNISRKKGMLKHPVAEARLKKSHGIEGDAHAGKWHRQVSLLAQESVDKMTARGAKNLTPGIFAENITTQGIQLHTLPIGTKLSINSALLEVTQIGKECHEHCQVFQQVGMCIMPIEGIFTRVLEEGTIKPGDEIKIITAIRAAIITLSDKGASGERADKSGPALVEALKDHAQVVETLLLPDDLEGIKNALIRLADSGSVDLILTTGGTGFTPRDVTPEATLAIVDRVVPGIPEAIRQASLAITPRAMLSRAAAGIRKRTLIVNLPGSPKAAVECLQVFLPVLGHAMETLRGDAYECAAPPSSE
jgi:molybdenum cofactor synthesis domain-containing protein